MKLVFLLFVGALNSGFATTTAEPQQTKPNIKYQSGKDVVFGSTTIQGSLQRPEISVVTGNEMNGDNGLLRLRENFMDRIASDFAEEVEP